MAVFSSPTSIEETYPFLDTLTHPLLSTITLGLIATITYSLTTTVMLNVTSIVMHNPLVVTPPAVYSRADATIGRVGVEDVASALVEGVVGHAMREEIKEAKGGEGLEGIVGMMRR